MDEIRITCGRKCDLNYQAFVAIAMVERLEQEFPRYAAVIRSQVKGAPRKDSPLSGARPTSKKDDGLGTGSGDRGREE